MSRPQDPPQDDDSADDGEAPSRRGGRGIRWIGGWLAVALVLVAVVWVVLYQLAS
ncbi:hypothetical protein SAMN05661080_03157 [Modestobacter sp. DSM 44400]|uniref:hypothetical protein n=1 Tax=Modestobacter sp. DSM 44400 TaxID=1550230 RepID=UPI000895CBB1|nr:hypothetical protein [Modestobacter sp. DSM 44400]SDY34724.1 hypothetical protein SAMN05661080_03157 [Modestobacter sp. DSM 44400]